MTPVGSALGRTQTRATSDAWERVRLSRDDAMLADALRSLGVDPPLDSGVADESRRGWADANIDCLIQRGAIGRASAIELRRDCERIIESTSAFVTSDGNVAIRHGDDPSGWSWLGDANEPLVSARESLEPESGGMHQPVVQCGIAPPVAVLNLHKKIRAMDPEYLFTRRVVLVHEDLQSLAASLTCANLTEVFDDPCVLLFLGHDAHPRFAAAVQEHLSDALPKRIFHCGIGDGTGPDQEQALSSRIARTIQQGLQMQRDELDELREVNDRWAAGNTFETARACLRDGALGTRSLRVMICTTRYSTYTMSAGEGLRDALNSMGHEAHLLVERERGCVFTGLSCARAIRDIQPDLVVMVNYPRSAVSGAIPDRVPFAVWIQDAMPHLLSKEAGDATTGWDVFAGATMMDLQERFGYRAESMMPYPVTACAQRFTATPVSQDEAQRYACDVAFVSHHSESPEDLFARLRLGFQGESVRVADALWDEAQRIVENAAHVSPRRAVAEAVGSCVQRVARREATPEEAARLRYGVLEPLVGRLYRHRTLEMVVRVCDRRGWSLRLFGNGWEQAHEFSRYASSAVEHGEPLRACYQSARTHLHIDLNTITHQRVFECALSGGLPMMRICADSLSTSEIHAFDELVEKASPILNNDGGDCVYSADATPLARRLQKEREACGLGKQDVMEIDPALCALLPGHRFYRERTAAPFDAIEVLGGLDGVTFTDERTLENALERAINDAAWREERSARMREGIVRLTSTGAFAQRLLEHTARVLGWRDHAGRIDMNDIRVSYDNWIEVERDA